MRIWTMAAAAVAMVVASAPAQAVVSLNIFNDGANVLAIARGSLDLTGLAAIRNTSSEVPSIRGNTPFATLSGSGQAITVYSGLAGSRNFSFSGFPLTFVDAAGVSAFGFDLARGEVWVSQGYVSRTEFSTGTGRFNASIAAAGFQPGVYEYTTPSDIIRVIIGSSSALPEPASWGMMLAGFGMIGAAARGRRRTRVAYAR